MTDGHAQTAGPFGRHEVENRVHGRAVARPWFRGSRPWASKCSSPPAGPPRGMFFTNASTSLRTGQLRRSVASLHRPPTSQPSTRATFATQTQARSTTLARRAKAPVAKGVDWSPTSSGSGSRRRRRNAICIACGGIAVAASQGMAVSHAPACGPARERSIAWELSDNAGRARDHDNVRYGSAMRGSANHVANPPRCPRLTGQGELLQIQHASGAFAPTFILQGATCARRFQAMGRVLRDGLEHHYVILGAPTSAVANGRQRVGPCGPVSRWRGELAKFPKCSARGRDFIQNFQNPAHEDAIFLVTFKMRRAGTHFSSKSSRQLGRSVFERRNRRRLYRLGAGGFSAQDRHFERRKSPRAEHTGTQSV